MSDPITMRDGEDTIPQEGWDFTDDQHNAAADAYAVQLAVLTGETIEEAIRWYGPRPGSSYQARFDEIIKTMNLASKTPGDVLRNGFDKSGGV